MLQNLSKATTRHVFKCSSSSARSSRFASSLQTSTFTQEAPSAKTTTTTTCGVNVTPAWGNSMRWFSSSPINRDHDDYEDEIQGVENLDDIMVEAANDFPEPADMKTALHDPAPPIVHKHLPKEDRLDGNPPPEDATMQHPHTTKPLSAHMKQQVIERIERQELNGGRMRSAQHGVLHEDPKIDMRLLSENYSVTSLASALRDREDVLQHCATLAENEDYEGLKNVLKIFHPRYVLQRRTRKRRLDVSKHLDAGSLEVIRKALMRMPRTVSTAHSQRAGVVIPLCLVNGVPSLLLEKRSPHLRAHADEVCLPGGMVCSINDTTIVSTCLREMKEEIQGLDTSIIQVLGVLRCNWGEVHHLVGVAVTPVVCFLGELPKELDPNLDEVAKVFTIPLASLLEDSLWVHKEDLAPIFVGGPDVIWGLTGYILERFARDVILPNHVRKDHFLDHHSLMMP